MTDHQSARTADALRPCPFCGGPACMTSFGNTELGTRYRYAVYCEHCMVVTESAAGFTEGVAKLRAKQRWNRRYAE